MPNSVEQRSIKIVMDYERSQGRAPVDLSPKKCAYDIKSGNRLIEVKGTKEKKPTWFYISPNILNKLGKEVARLYVYIVYDINNKPKLKIMETEDIFKSMKTFTQFFIPHSAISKYGKDVDLHSKEDGVRE